MSEIKLQKKIGISLRSARRAKRYTQEEVAQGVGLSANYYATLERGEAIASLETMYKIFQVLNVKASDIFPDKI